MVIGRMLKAKFLFLALRMPLSPDDEGGIDAVIDWKSDVKLVAVMMVPSKRAMSSWTPDLLSICLIVLTGCALVAVRELLQIKRYARSD